MKKIITISIPKPCHEDWKKMTPTEKGKFCKVCTKEVFDFTNVSDEELVKKVYNKEKLCGRFKSSQLNRELILERKSKFSIASLVTSFLLPLTLLASLKTEPSNKSSKLQGKFYKLDIKKNSSDKLQIITNGKIIGKNGKPLFDVEITIKGFKKTEFSGLNGDYRIASANDEVLVFKKEGFISQEIILTTKSETINITLLKEELGLKAKNTGKISLKKTIKIQKDSIPNNKQDSSKLIIKGNIIDDTGIPLPGVNIVVKGTSIGSQSDFDGNFKLDVDKNAVLVFSYVGFNTEEVTLSNINNVNLQMQMNEDWAGEIIITGGINYDYSKELMGFKKSSYDSEPTEWRKKAQISFDNEKEFSRIKRERKKEIRKNKRNKKK